MYAIAADDNVCLRGGRVRKVDANGLAQILSLNSAMPQRGFNIVAYLDTFALLLRM